MLNPKNNKKTQNKHTDIENILDYNFNDSLLNWDTSKVTDMFQMFRYTRSFNQDISNWDVSKAIHMPMMFQYAKSFNQDLSNWDVQYVVDCRDFRTGATNFQLPVPNFEWCNTSYGEILHGTWTLSNESWIGTGTWPDGQARGCWKSGDEGSPDKFIFKRLVTKKVWECFQDGKLANDLVTYGPFNWSFLDGDTWDSATRTTINGKPYEIWTANYNIAGETIQINFKFNEEWEEPDNIFSMEMIIDDGNILQTWKKTSNYDD